MTKLVTISGKEFCKILEKLGFEKIYGKGSHIRFKHPDGRRTVVPVHGNEDLDSSVDKVVELASKIKGYEWKGCKCMEDGTSLILENET